LVAKFIPGFSTVAPPLAGALGIGTASFVLWDAGGALLWSGAAVVSGMIFHRAIDRVVGALTDAGGWALVVLGAALALFIAVKWWERRRFYQFLRMARISVDEVWKLIEDGKDPIILDVRTAEGRAVNPRRIKGAAVLELDNFDRALEKLPRDREIILYCT
jgi:hypothetical protein